MSAKGYGSPAVFPFPTSHDSVVGICIRDERIGINNEKRTKEGDYGPLPGHGEP
jgi:hypothetical protein